MSAPDSQRVSGSLYASGTVPRALAIAAWVLAPFATFAPFLAAGKPMPAILSALCPLAAALAAGLGARERRWTWVAVALAAAAVWGLLLSFAPEIQGVLGAGGGP